MKFSGIKRAILIPFFSAGVLTLLIFSYVVFQDREHYLQSQFDGKVQQVTSQLQLEMDYVHQKIWTALDLLRHDPQLKAWMQAGDRAALRDYLAPRLDSLQQNFVTQRLYIHDQDARNLLRLHDAERFGDHLQRETLQQAEVQQRLVSGLVLDGAGSALLSSVAPVYQQDQLIGFIELAQPLNALSQRYARQLSAEVIPLYHSRLLDPAARHSVGDYQPDREYQGPLPEALLSQLLRQPQQGALRYKSGERYLLAQLSPLHDLSSRSIGWLLIYSDVSQLEQADFMRMLWMMVAILLVGSALGGFFYWILQRADNHIRDKAQELLNVNRLLKTSQNIAGFGRWEYDYKTQALHCSSSAREILSLNPEDQLIEPADLLRYSPDSDHQDFERFWQQESAEGDSRSMVHQVIHRDGRLRTINQQAQLIRDHDGRSRRLMATVNDISEFLRADLLQQRIARIFEHAWNELYLFDSKTLKFVDASLGAQRNLGYSIEQLRTMQAEAMLPEFDAAEFRSLLHSLTHSQESYLAVETMLQRRDGSHYPVELRLQLIDERSGGALYLAIVQDISERKRYLAELQHHALFDGLTGLPNRTLFTDRLILAIKHAKRNQQPLTVVVMDIAYLKEVNNILGFESGDKLLCELAELLTSVVRDSDTLAHLYGGEFVLLLPGATVQQSISVIEKIQHLIREPLLQQEVPVRVEAHYGLVEYPRHGESDRLLMQRADIALGIAKGEVRGYAIYDATEDTYSRDQLHLKSELFNGVEERQFTLFYQPQVEFCSKRIVGFEALARWPHPQLGMISPGDFIPLIEGSGLINRFTLWAVKRASQQIAQLEQQGLVVNISVNVSARCLYDEKLPHSISEIVAGFGVAPERLILEITETTLMKRPEQALKVIQQLAGLGFHISIDDYGTGYSSLSYLKNLPVKELKIDQSFIFRVVDNPYDTTIVRSTIDMAHDLGMVVVAEGVESFEQFAVVASLGGDIAQGYFLSKPLPEDQVLSWSHSFYRENGLAGMISGTENNKENNKVIPFSREGGGG